VRGRVMDALLKMHLDPDGKKVLEQFGAKRFIETRNEEYDIIVKYAGDLHLVKRDQTVQVRRGGSDGADDVHTGQQEDDGVNRQRDKDLPFHQSFL